jgi:hypothetical protein
VSVDRRLSDAIADDLLDQLDRDPGLAQIRHRVQITSFGGSGTTALYDHLRDAGVDLPTTPGAFPFKHQRVPPDGGTVPDGFRVIYPFGDPRNAVVSVFRRGFQGGHYRGMRLRKPAPDVDDRLATLEAFLAGGVDEFDLEDHFDRWYATAGRDYPVLFLRSEDLAGAWPAVREFLDLPDDTAGLPVRQRESAWQHLPPRERERIDEMYGPFAQRLAALPSVVVR